MKNFYENKTICITGGVGSIGSALVKRIIEYNPKVIRVLDINETALFHLERELHSGKIRVLVGDIRDKDRLARAVEDVDILFHAAALKHVSLCESNPFEAVQTNVLGTKNLIEISINEKIDKFITISTDKAVNPISVLGASKLLAERLTVSANVYKGKRKTVFSCVRFGNVLNSQGSVLTIFREQLRKGGPITVTDKSMTRFIMSIDKATKLVLKAAQMSKGGEIFILKMSTLRIIDLAKAVIEEMAPRYGYTPQKIRIVFIGRKNGEKIYEELMHGYEAYIGYEKEDMFILPPVNFNKSNSRIQKTMYKSSDCKFMTIEAIKELLRTIPDDSVFLKI